MQKVMIIGPPGAGKSTLARTLGELTQLPVYHLDALYWKPGWVSAQKDEWNALQQDLVQKDKWIIDGNYGGTYDIRMAAADLIIFLDFPRRTALYRVLKRRIQYHGKTRPDLNEGCPEKLDLEFLKYVYLFNKNKRPGLLRRLADLSEHKHVVILKTPSEVAQFIDQIKTSLTNVTYGGVLL